MTEASNPSNPSDPAAGTGTPMTEYGSPATAPEPPGAPGYPPPPPSSYSGAGVPATAEYPPPAYLPPAAEMPPAEPARDEAPPAPLPPEAARHEAPAYPPPPPAPASNQAAPAAPPAYDTATAGAPSAPPAYDTQPAAAAAGGFAAGAAHVGQQFQNFDPKTLQDFDPKSVNPLDWGIIGAGVLAFLFSFFSFYTVKVSALGFGIGASGHENAWHGFFGWFGVLLVLIASAVLAAELIARISFPFPSRLVVLGGFAIGLLCELLALLVVPVDTGNFSALGVKVDKGHGFGFWAVLLLVLIGTGLAFRRFTETGGKLPQRR
jgi:hypothetical protein